MHPLLAALLSLSPALRPAQFGEPLAGWGELEVCETWDTSDGLPQCSVNDALQTRDGFLWVATHGGLARFDGAEFRTFGAATPGLEAARITRLLESSSGDLWIGASTSVARYRDGRFERIPAPGNWGTGRISALVEDRDGALWVAGQQLYRVRDEALEIVPTGLAGVTAVTDLLLTRDGALLAATDRGLLRLRGDRSELLIEDQEQDFQRLVADAGGRIWGYGGRRELFCLSDVLLRFPLAATEMPDDSLRVYLREALLDERGDLLFVGDARLWRLRCDETAEGLVARARLEPSTELGFDGPACSLSEDRDGNVWVGRSWHGLQRLGRKPFRVLPAPGRERTALLTLWADGPGGVVAQLLDGGLLEVDGRLEPRLLPGERPAPPSVCLDADRTFWSIEVGELVRRARDGEVLARSATPFPGAKQLIPAADGALWVGGPRKLARLAGGDFELVDWGDSESVHSVQLDPDGGAWLASGTALGHWDGASVELFEVADGLPRAELRGLLVDSDGTVWVTTYGRGLARLRDGEFTCFDRRQGLLDDYLGGLQSAADGRLFVNSNRGLLVLDRGEIAAFERGELAEIPCRLLATGEGSGNRSHRTADGLLWFPTMDGLAVLDPELDRAARFPARLRIEGLTVDGVARELSSGLTLAAGDGDVELSYVAPFFGEPGGVRYRYVLEGRDRAWIDAGATRKASYRGLPPGDYVFRVAATSGAGEWSAQALAFELRPHLHQTPLFPASVGLLLLLIGFGLHRARIKTLRAHGRALQAEITERKAAEGVRRRAEEQLRESSKLEAVGRLAGGIAHDFNNVLTAILGHVELLRMQSEILAPADIVGHADAIESCSTKAGSLTHQLLAFSRRQVLRPRVVDVNAIVLGLEKLLTHLLPETIELHIETAPDTGFVRADPSQLEQVVMNLILNARDAMPAGGELLVQTRRERVVQDGEVRQHAAISVEDDGRGIHPDDLPHVFEPFFTTKGSGGTGLGLASVHGIVVQSGGQVVVDSELGRGATFRVLLPAVEDAAPAGEPDHVPLAEHRGSETILVCDDYDPVRSVTRRTLEEYGYTVLVADHPLRALERARATEHPPALLVTDFSMPGMTGRELADRMLFEHPHLRVLFISGYTSNVALRREVVDDEVAFLAKPFAPEELARRVREVLDGVRGRA